MRELTIEELHMVSGGGSKSSGSANHGDMYDFNGNSCRLDWCCQLFTSRHT